MEVGVQPNVLQPRMASAVTGAREAETDVRQAETDVRQAEAGVIQAEAGVRQAEMSVRQVETGGAGSNDTNQEYFSHYIEVERRKG
jgi:hypothetical protein